MRLHGLVLTVALLTPACTQACDRETLAMQPPGRELTGRDANLAAAACPVRSRLRLRLDEGGSYTLTDAAGGRSGTRHLAAGRLDGDSADTRVALDELEDALAGITADPRTQEADSYSKIELGLTADPLVPWRHVQWALLKAASPRVRIWKLAFCSEPSAPPMRIKLPKDRSCCPGKRAIRLELRVRLARMRDSSSPDPFTRVTLAAVRLEYDEGYMSPTFDGPEPDVTKVGAFDLPPDAAPAAKRRRAWLRVESALRDQIPHGDRPLGILLAPPPLGGGVPYRDVVAAMWVLRGVGAELVRLEGAFAPLEEVER